MSKLNVEEYVYQVDVLDDPNTLPTTLGMMKGDIIVYRGPNDPVRLPVGSNGQVLVADSTSELGVKWATL